MAVLKLKMNETEVPNGDELHVTWGEIPHLG